LTPFQYTGRNGEARLRRNRIILGSTSISFTKGRETDLVMIAIELLIVERLEGGTYVDYQVPSSLSGAFHQPNPSHKVHICPEWLKNLDSLMAALVALIAG